MSSEETAQDRHLVLLAWDAVTRDDALLELLRCLAEGFACHSSALVFADGLRPAANVAIAYGPLSDPAIQQRYASDFAALDPAPRALASLPIGQVASTDLLFADSVERYRPFLDGFYYPLGLAGALGGPLARSSERTGMIAVHRGPRREPFGEGDIARLCRLMPHLVRMLETRRAFFELRNETAEALESASSAILVLDESGCLKRANLAARRILASNDGLALHRSSRIVASDEAANQKLQQALATRRSCDAFVRVPRGGTATPYILRVRSLDAAAGHEVMIADPERRLEDVAGGLASALNLTPGGADLLAALLSGGTLGDYASRRGISRNTVKYHLHAAFAATGTRRQGDLLRKAAAVVRDLRL